MTTNTSAQKGEEGNQTSILFSLIAASLLVGGVKILWAVGVASYSGQQISTSWLIDQADSAYGIMFNFILMFAVLWFVMFTTHFIITGRPISRNEPISSGVYIIIVIVTCIALLLFDTKISPLIFGDPKATMVFNTQSEVDKAMKLSKVYDQIYLLLLPLNLGDRLSRFGALIIQVAGYISSLEGCIAFYERVVKKKSSKETQ